MTQTAVEWLDENLQDTMYIQYGYSDGVRKIVIPIDEYMKLKQQAKEIEKQQIIDAYIKNRYIDTSLSNPIRTDEAEQYYNETYGI